MWWNRQTRCLEGAVEVTPCQFESGHRHRAFCRHLLYGFSLVVAAALMMAFVAPANALLMGEKAKNAPVAPLRIAVQMYDKGDSHERIWQKTGWYCPNRDTDVCRWEAKPDCTSIKWVNMTAIQHTTFTGKIPLWRVFNTACVWEGYPSLRNKVVVYLGGCGGNWGTAWHDGSTGEICIHDDLMERIKKGAPEAERQLYWVFVHELQHQIQFMERWSEYNWDCPYKLREWEEEARIVSKRAFMDADKRRKNPPAWYKPGLC